MSVKIMHKAEVTAYKAAGGWEATGTRKLKPAVGPEPEVFLSTASESILLVCPKDWATIKDLIDSVFAALED